MNENFVKKTHLKCKWLPYINPFKFYNNIKTMERKNTGLKTWLKQMVTVSDHHPAFWKNVLKLCLWQTKWRNTQILSKTPLYIILSSNFLLQISCGLWPKLIASFQIIVEKFVENCFVFFLFSTDVPCNHI